MQNNAIEVYKEKISEDWKKFYFEKVSALGSLLYIGKIQRKFILCHTFHSVQKQCFIIYSTQFKIKYLTTVRKKEKKLKTFMTYSKEITKK